MLKLADNLKLPLEAVTQTFGILAVRGAGKTYTAAVLVEELCKAGLRSCVIDPIGVWWGLRAGADKKTPGLPVIVLGGEHGDLPLEVTAGALIADLVVDEDVSVVIDVSLFRKGEQKRFIMDFAEKLYHRNRRALHLVIDEADAFAPQRPMPGDQRLLGAIEDLVRRGRARGIGVTLVTQRAAVLNKDVLTQCETLIALRTVAPQDRKAIDSWVEVHGSREERDTIMHDLPQLKRGEAWVWSPGWLGILKKVQIRLRETFDSSATPKAGERRVTPKVLAQVDLETLRVRMAETVERMEAADPNRLKREVEKLKFEVDKLKNQLLQRDHQLAMQKSPKVITNNVPLPVLEDKHLAKLEKLFGALNEQIVTLQTRLDTFKTKPVSSLLPELRKPQLLTAETSPTIRRFERPQAEVLRNDPTVPLPIGEQAILKAVAPYTEGATREQITVLTGYKTSTRNAYIQRLSEKGLLVIENGAVLATDDGIKALGSDYEPLPTGDALRAYWLTRLPEGEQKILRTIIEQHPTMVSRDSLTEATGYKTSTRNAYLQRLATRKLVISRSGGMVQASDHLFS